MFYEVILPVLLIVVVFGAVTYFRKKLNRKTFRIVFAPVVFAASGVLWYYAIFTEDGNFTTAVLMIYLAVYQLFFYKEPESN